LFTSKALKDFEAHRNEDR